MQLQYESSIGMPLSAYAVKILSFTASISGPDQVIDAVRQAFPTAPAWPPALSSEAQLDLRVWQSGNTCDSWHLTQDDTTHEGHSLAELQALLVWMINSKAVEWIGRDHLLFHAGSVAVGQAGIILPARSGSGKSTLTAALIAQGCSYFSDEVAVIAPDSGLLLPFPKALKIEPASLPLLANDYPELGSVADRRAGSDLGPTYLRPPDSAWPTAPAEPMYVIFPRYEHGATTCLEPVSRADAFARLLDHAFSTGTDAAQGIHQIVQLLQGCECYDLTMGDLDDAVSQFLRLAGESA